MHKALSLVQIALLLFVSGFAAAQDVSFTPATIASAPQSIIAAAGDINGDGVIDIITGRSELTLYLGTIRGSLIYTPIVIDTDLETIHGINIADVNDDGLLDLVVCNSRSVPDTAGEVAWYQNMDSSGSNWSSVHPIASKQNSQVEACAVGDLTDSDTPDIIAVWSGDIEIYKRGITGVFTTDQSLNATVGLGLGHPNSVLIQDMNADNLPDVVVGFGLGMAARWYSAPNFPQLAFPNTAGRAVSGVAAADFNQDGFMDIATSGDINPESWHQSDGGALPIFTQIAINGVASPHSYGVCATDINFDGKIDLVSMRDGLRWLENAGAGNFTDHLISSDYSRVNLVADFDQDGRMDVLASHGDPNSGELVIFLQDNRFIRGDCNADGGLNIGDAITTLEYLFADPSDLLCLDACDSNDDGSINIADAIYLLSYLFSGGPAPVSSANACGPDETNDDLLTCLRFSPCP